jgi:hypothetical protein
MSWHAGSQARSITRTASGLVVLVALVGMDAGCAPDPQTDETLVATYRDGAVTATDLERWRVTVGRDTSSADARKDVEELVLVRVLADGAIAHRLDRQPAVAFELRLVEERSLQAAWNRHLAATVRIPADEVEAVLAANPGAFSKPRRVRVHNIYKHFPHGATAEDRAAVRRRMEEIRAELLAGGDFAAIAAAESDSETRYRGGRMGTFGRGELPPALDAVVMGLEKGEVSGILETADGLTILMCDGVFEAEAPGPDEARAKIEANLLRLRRRDNLQRVQEEILDRSGLEIDTAAAIDPVAEGDQVVATFGRHSLTRAELDQLSAARRPAGAPPIPLDEPLVRQTVEAHVVTVLSAEAARDAGLDTEDVRAGIEIQRQRVLATQELRRRVDLRLVEPTDEEIEEHFEAHRGELLHPEEVDLMMVDLAFTDETLRSVHAEATAACDAVASGAASFEEAFRSLASPGGGVAPKRAVTLTPLEIAGYGVEISNAVRGLAPGEVSRPIRRGDRLWVVQLVDRRPARPLGLEEAAPTVRRRLGQERVDALTDLITTEILAEQQISIVGQPG